MTEAENKKDIVSIEEVNTYLGIDYDDDVSKENIKRFISVAEKYIQGAIDKVPENDERVKQLALFIIEDLYDRSSYSIKENAAITRIKNSIIMQLQYGDANDEL